MKKLLLLCLLASAACVTTAQEGEEMKKDIAGLKVDLRKESDAAEGERKKLADEQTQRAKALQDALDQLSRAALKSGASLAVDMEKAQQDILALHGQLEVLQHRLDAIEKTQGEQAKSIEALNGFMAQRQKDLDHPTDRIGIYELGRQKLEAGQTARARELFNEFLAKFPKDELAPNAQYWLGETFYKEQKYDLAIAEFRKVLKEYKDSEKVPDALLKIGLAFAAQSDCKSALLFFTDLEQKYKASAAAKTAKASAAACRKKRSD